MINTGGYSLATDYQLLVERNKELERELAAAREELARLKKPTRRMVDAGGAALLEGYARYVCTPPIIEGVYQAMLRAAKRKS